jgi:hypothetical protein
MEREPVSTITNLKDIDNIKLVLLINGESEIKKVISNKEEINRFLQSFKPAINPEKCKDNLQQTNFSRNGEIIIVFKNDTPIFVIDIDVNYGYSVVIKSKRYYKKFTYQTGRFILESLSADRSSLSR